MKVPEGFQQSWLYKIQQVKVFHFLMLPVPHPDSQWSDQECCVVLASCRLKIPFHQSSIQSLFVILITKVEKGNQERCIEDSVDYYCNKSFIQI